MGALYEFEHRVKSTIWFDTTTQWSDLDWVGHDVSGGETVLRIRDRTKRCQATTANLHKGERDIDMLRVLSTWGHQDFCVYAEVIHTGSVALSDQVKVL
ncbi:MOSC domain-containing protein [Sulfitobacter sp. R86518]|uniref:MOSC domain-containing protein n=1 Tax=Sulfitobacter sp. R86518 TaxID=3093858 RepID=UPI0036DB4DD8